MIEQNFDTFDKIGRYNEDPCKVIDLTTLGTEGSDSKGDGYDDSESDSKENENEDDASESDSEVDDEWDVHWSKIHGICARK